MKILRNLAGLLVLASVSAFAQWSDFCALTESTNLCNAMNGQQKFQVYAGNPNTHVAGMAGKDRVWDSTNNVDYVCITTGNAAAAVWAALTNAAIVPNTVPTAGQILVGNAGNTAYAPVSMSGDGAISSTGALALSAKYKVWAQNINIPDPVTGDSGRFQFRLPFAGTMTSIACSVKAATSVTINVEKRAVSTPDTAGTAALTSNLACDTDSAVSTTFTSASIAADIPVAITITAVSGTPDVVRIHIKGTID